MSFFKNLFGSDNDDDTSGGGTSKVARLEQDIVAFVLEPLREELVRKLIKFIRKGPEKLLENPYLLAVVTFEMDGVFDFSYIGYPDPNVIRQEYWLAHYKVKVKTKGDVIEELNKVFKKHNFRGDFYEGDLDTSTGECYSIGDDLRKLEQAFFASCWRDAKKDMHSELRCFLIEHEVERGIDCDTGKDVSSDEIISILDAEEVDYTVLDKDFENRSNELFKIVGFLDNYDGGFSYQLNAIQFIPIKEGHESEIEILRGLCSTYLEKMKKREDIEQETMYDEKDIGIYSKQISLALHNITSIVKNFHNQEEEVFNEYSFLPLEADYKTSSEACQHRLAFLQGAFLRHQSTDGWLIKNDYKKAQLIHHILCSIAEAKDEVNWARTSSGTGSSEDKISINTNGPLWKNLV